MDPVAAAIPIVQTFEGFRSAPYLCPAGVPTIGYGSTHYEDGRAVTLHDPPIDQSRADELLRVELERALRSCRRLINVELSESQWAALCDFVYNLGAGALQASTLRRVINRGDGHEAPDQFMKWVYAGKPPRKLPGLIKRREAEAALWQR